MSYHTFCFLTSLPTLLFFFLFCLSSQFFSLLSISFYVFVLPYFSSLLSLPFTVHNQGLFILPTVIRFTVLSLNYFWSGVDVLPRPPISLLAAQPPPLLCAGCATFHSQTKGVLFYFLAFHGILIQIRVGYSLLLTPMVCTQQFQFIFLSFGWYVIPTGHFPQKSLSGNPRIDFPLFPTARSYPLVPLTHGPPRLYWLGTSGWCLSLVCVSLPCESMAYLLFMHLPLLAGLSGLAACFATYFYNLLWRG